ncbi:MAG: methyl-accepting chemotaxis protein, partial [Plesiomonas shigelloides]
IGKTLSGADTEQIRQMLQQGKTQVLAQQGNLLVFAPISLRGVQQKWGVVLDVSEATALAKATAAERAIADEFRQAIWIQLLVGLALALFGMLGIGWAARAIAQPLNQVVAMLRRLSAAGGDLTQRLDIRRKDETGELAREVNQLISHIHSIVTDVAGTTLTLQQAAGNSAVSSQQALRRTQLQLQEIEQIAAAVNEMSSTAHSVTDSAQMTASAVEQTRHAVERGQHVVNDTASSIQQLSTQVDSVAGEIQSLELQSQQIGTILDVIRNISDQTNLLALNAAIEAARAGEHGRGFAVVADEVRGLASKTQHSTTEIQAMIDSLRQTTSNAVATMSEGRQLSQQALNDIAHAVNALDEIVTAADQIQDMTTQIASAAEEQFAVTEDINRNIVNINQAASEVADGARKNNSDTQHMNELTAEVMTNLSRFRY